MARKHSRQQETLDTSFGVRLTIRQKEWLDRKYGRQRGLFIRKILLENGMPSGKKRGGKHERN